MKVLKNGKYEGKLLKADWDITLDEKEQKKWVRLAVYNIEDDKVFYQSFDDFKDSHYFLEDIEKAALEKYDDFYGRLKLLERDAVRIDYQTRHLKSELMNDEAFGQM